MQVDRSHLFTQREQYSAPSAPGHTQPRTPDGRAIRPRLLISAITACLLPAVALAGPKNGQVVAGNASIHKANAKKTVIRQRSRKSVINWERFSIGRKEYVKFVQPKKSSISLNRVVGGDPSKILGKMSANGQVYLVNPNGIYFGEGARVDVSGIVASVLDISDADFMSGKFVFEGDLDENLGEVINNGIINARNQGYVVLMGDYAENNGVIQAHMGKVVLASGSRVTMDISGNSLINVAVDEAAVSDLAGVKNSGEIYADGGRVIMTAKVADDLIGSAVNNQGLIRASSIVKKDGSIFLTASGGDVVNSGILDASAADGSKADGGGVLVYSDRNVTLTSTSQINARGDGRGAGGTVRVIAQDMLDFQSGAAISVAGKPHRGGFVEVSGHAGLKLRGEIDLGSGGTLLIDPSVLTINPGAGAPNGTAFASVGSTFIVGQLTAGNDVYLVASDSITASGPMTLTANNAGDGDLNLAIGTLSASGGTLGGTTGGTTYGQCNSAGVCLGGFGTVKVNADPTGDILLGNVRFNLDGRLNVAAGTMSGTVSLGTVFDAARLDVAGGSVTGSVTLDNVEVDGQINITTGTDINFQGRVGRGGGGLSATAGNDILVDGGIGSDGTFEGPGPFNGPVNLNADNDVIVNEDIYAGANNINLNADVDGNGSGDVNINGRGSCSDGCFGEPTIVQTTGNLRVTGQNFNVIGVDFGPGSVSSAVQAPVTVKANRVNVDINGDMNVSGGRGNLNLFSGSSSPQKVDVSVKVTGTNQVNVTADNMTVQGGTAMARVSGGGSTYGSAQVLADAEASVTGGDITLNLGGTLEVRGGDATANITGSCSNCNADADASARISGDDVTLNSIGGDLSIQGGSADASADASCNTCSVIADASAEIRGDKVSIKSLAGDLSVIGQSDSARAELSGSMASGFARANAYARLSAAKDLSADVGGRIDVFGGDAQADGYWIDASKMEARANADGTIEAGGNLKLNAVGGLNIDGGTANASPTTSGGTNGTASASAKALLKAGGKATIEVTGGSLALSGGSSNPNTAGTSYSASPRAARASGSIGSSPLRKASASARIKADQLQVMADDINGSSADIDAKGVYLHASNSIVLINTTTKVGNGSAPGVSGDSLTLEIMEAAGIPLPANGDPNLKFTAGGSLYGGDIEVLGVDSYLWFEADNVAGTYFYGPGEISTGGPQGRGAASRGPEGTLTVQYSPHTPTYNISLEQELVETRPSVAAQPTGTVYYTNKEHIEDQHITTVVFGSTKQTGPITVGANGKLNLGSKNILLLTTPDKVNSTSSINTTGIIATSGFVASVEGEPAVFITPRLDNFEVEISTIWDEEEERKKRLVETPETKHGMCTAL